MRRLAISLLAATMAVPAFAAGPIFTDETLKAGITANGNGKGVAIADYDNDGNWDIYLSNKGGHNILYRNNGNGSFTDVTAKAGVSDAGFTLGSVFFDYDNDGYADLYLPKGGRYEIEANRLYHNNGDGTFTDVTDKAGVGYKGFTYAAASSDFDHDGYLDIYLANYGVDKTNILYKNNGDGTFTDVTAKAGVGDRAWSWMAVWADVNGDGWDDLYVVNGRYPAGEPNSLYLNNGNGTFKNVSRESGADDANWGLGAAFSDLDRDGDLDLFVSNYVGPNGLYINDGTGRFARSDSKKVGLDHTGWGKGPSWGDVDNDGDLDLYEGDCKVSNQLYINDGKGHFADMTKQNPDVACATDRTKGTVFFDFDKDGDLDLFVVNWATPSKFYVNHTDNRDYLKVKLVGSMSNRMAVGSRVWVREGKNLVGMRDMQTSSGFVSQPPQELHFGLSAAKTYTVEVRFPSGLTKVVENVKAGQTITIEEPGAVAKR